MVLGTQYFLFHSECTWDWHFSSVWVRFSNLSNVEKLTILSKDYTDGVFAY